MNHKSQSIILWVLGASFVLSFFVSLAVLVLNAFFLLNCLVPLNLGLLISLLTSFVVYIVKRELTTTIAAVVFVLATLAAFVLVINVGGFAA